MKDVYILDPVVEWNIQQGTGYFYQDAIFRAEIREPYTIISAPHPVEVWFDGKFAYEAYEGDFILPPKSPTILELKIPSWVFYAQYIPPGANTIYVTIHPEVYNKKFLKKFIIKKGFIPITTNKKFIQHLEFEGESISTFEKTFTIKKELKKASASFYIGNDEGKWAIFYIYFMPNDDTDLQPYLIYYNFSDERYLYNETGITTNRYYIKIRIPSENIFYAHGSLLWEFF